jgi:hypothetical protein
VGATLDLKYSAESHGRIVGTWLLRPGTWRRRSKSAVRPYTVKVLGVAEPLAVTKTADNSETSWRPCGGHESQAGKL